jgi:hypothetical protein
LKPGQYDLRLLYCQNHECECGRKNSRKELTASSACSRSLRILRLCFAASILSYIRFMRWFRGGKTVKIPAPPAFGARWRPPSTTLAWPRENRRDCGAFVLCRSSPTRIRTRNRTSQTRVTWISSACCDRRERASHRLVLSHARATQRSNRALNHRGREAKPLGGCEYVCWLTQRL